MGAAIGGAVTVISLSIRGRQELAREERRLQHEEYLEKLRIGTEEERRKRDRQWDITMEGIAVKRETFTRFLRAVAAYVAHLDDLFESEHDPARMESLLGAIVDLVPDVAISAQNKSSVDLVNEFIQQAEVLRSLLLESGSTTEVVGACERIREKVSRLTNAFRWDIGSNADPPAALTLDRPNCTPLRG